MGSFLSSALGTNNDFKSSKPEIDKQNFMNAIQQAQAGLAQNQASQGQLAQVLQGQAQGVGPNPAQNMLNQAVDKNQHQAAGMIASQRGINPALAARLAAENQASISQQAAGQAATMHAQQMLGAQGQLGGLYNQMAAQNLQNNSTLQNAQAAQNNAITAGSLGSDQINAGVAAGNQQMAGKLVGGVLQGLGGAASMGATSAPAAAAEGGRIPGAASVPGNSYANDTVPVLASPGEIIVPRSDASSADKAKGFIEHLFKEDQSVDFGKVLAAHNHLKSRIEMLERHVGSR